MIVMFEYSKAAIITGFSIRNEVTETYRAIWFSSSINDIKRTMYTFGYIPKGTLIWPSVTGIILEKEQSGWMGARILNPLSILVALVTTCHW